MRRAFERNVKWWWGVLLVQSLGVGGVKNVVFIPNRISLLLSSRAVG